MTNDQVFQLATRIDDAFFLIGAAIFAIEILEALLKRSLTGKTIWEMVVSGSTQIPYLLVEATLMTGAYAAFYALGDGLIPWSIPNTWWALVLALAFADLTYYWEHRIAHQVRLLWTQHAVHHSSRDMNIITGVRFGPLESVWALIMHVPMVIMGFAPEVVLGASLVVLAYQSWLHTELIGKLGPLEWILNTPSHHRVHHGSDDKYLDRNYGGILIVWDRTFGTFQEEEETPIYGLNRHFDSQNPFVVWFSEIPQLLHDLRAARGWSGIWGRLFRAPGWKP